MYIINKCKINYKYKFSVLSPVISKTIISNTAFTKIIQEKIQVNKFVNEEQTGLFNLLKYTILIYNISDEVVYNLFFKDIIPKGTSFIENSLTINNVEKRCANPELGFFIKKINIKGKIEITFKVIVTNAKYSYIKNTSDVEYDYICNVKEKLIRRFIESNTVKTKYEDNLFKQVLIRNTINLSSKIDYITKVKYVPKITAIKLLNCYIKERCGLLIIGKINYFIFCKYNGKSYIIEEISGFSICTLAPIGIAYLNNIDIKIKTDYSCTKLINKEKVFINSSFLIYS